jgi:hypothetical protein
MKSFDSVCSLPNLWVADQVEKSWPYQLRHETAIAYIGCEP